MKKSLAKRAHPIFEYFLFLVPSFLLISLFWSFFVDGKLYYCSDWFPFFDFIPPFVHGSQYGDYFIVNKYIVWTLWIILLVTMFCVPLVVMRINKVKKISLRQKILVTGGFVCVIVLGTLFYIIHTTLLTKYVQNIPKTSYKMGDFTLSLDSSTVAKDSDPFYKQIHVTEILPKTGDTTDCVHVGGLYYAYLEKPFPPNQNLYSKPHMYIEGWNMDTLSFDNNQSKAKAEKAIDQLNTLSKYEDEKKLQQIVTNPTYDADDFAVSDLRNFPNLSPWRGMYACSGNYSIPFMIKKIDTNKFGSVYFAEVSEGNGDTYNYPMRTLIIKKNNDWLLLKDEQKQFQEEKDGSSHPWPGCPTGTLSKQELACAINMWAKQYRNQEQDKLWITKMLSAITYTSGNTQTNYPTNPQEILKQMYKIQLDCANTYEGPGAPTSFETCLEKTSIFTKDNQKISVSCGKQNIPTYDEITIDPVKISGAQASAIVHTTWADGKDTPAEALLEQENNQWKVVSITCKNY